MFNRLIKIIFSILGIAMAAAAFSYLKSHNNYLEYKENEFLVVICDVKTDNYYGFSPKNKKWEQIESKSEERK
jgi:hypothetical protein